MFYAGGDTTMTGGGGTNEFVFSTAGNNTIKDFGASPSNELIFSNLDFNLGLDGATPSPQPIMPSEVMQLFDLNGTFTKASQRFAYDQSTGELFASSNGSAKTEHLVATLSDHATINASQLYFVA